jgi:hypothetical protein
MSEDIHGQVKVTMNRLRAQLCGIVESLNLTPAQESATKRMVKDRTSEAWNDLTTAITKSQEEK